MSTTKKIPSPLVSFLPIVLLIGMLFATIRTFGSDALSGGSQISLLTTTAVCVFIGVAFYRIPWRDYEIAITNNVAGVTSAIIILLIIGALSGAWMISGVVPTLIYYGMQIIHPDFFLTSTCVICALVSIMTGSSWTTIATIGIALLGIGKTQGFEEGWIAGAIISGAYFGDKVSPLSDTTVLAASVTDTPLFRHIRYMMITTIPSLVITLVIFTVMGFACETSGTEQIAEFTASLNARFHITPWLLIVPVVTGILIARKVPSIITLFLSTLLAATFAIIFQPELLHEISGNNDLFEGTMMSLYGSTSLQSDSAMLTGDCHTGHGRNDEHDMAHYLRHVFRWSNDGKRYAGKHHFRIRPVHEEYGQCGSIHRRFGNISQSCHSRPIHQHHPYRKHVQQHLREERIRKPPTEPHHGRCRYRNLCPHPVEHVRNDSGHHSERTHTNLSSLLFL